MQSRNISILGSTGSIGRNTLKVVEHLGDIRVVAMAAGRNMELFAKQINRFRPDIVSCQDDICANALLEQLSLLEFKAPKIELGEKGLVEVATNEKV